MLKTFYNDLEFLENKYHKTNEPFDPYNRMAYHGYEYDEKTGLNDEEMDIGLNGVYNSVKDLPHPIAKARLFEFVLDNARIDVNEKDWFVGFYNWGRPIYKYTSNIWNKEVFSKIPDTAKQIELFNKSGAVAIWPDFDHVVPNWTDLLDLGFRGLLERTQYYHKKNQSDISDEAEAFYEGIEISYKAILRLLDRYYNYALTKNNAKSKLQAECLKSIRDGKPKNLYEALQVMYLFYILCECVDNFQTRSLGNGIDSTLYPFYKKDIENGLFSYDEEREFTAYFLMQYSAIGNYWGQPMYMGGTDAAGNTKYNEMSYMILGLYEELRIYNPKIQIMVSEDTPKDVLYKVFKLLKSGVSSFVFCCEDGFRKAMKSYGVTDEEAQNFEISGCYETRVRSNESSSSVGYINTAKAIELAIFNGVDPKTKLKVGKNTGEFSNFKTFDDFYRAFIEQLDYLIDETIKIGNSYEDKLNFINPSNLYSSTIKSSLESGKDGYCFGVKYRNSVLLNSGFANAVDSLMAVKDICFDNRKLSPAELKNALQNNWNGYEKMRMYAQKLSCKYGNGDCNADAIASTLAEHFCKKVNGRPNARDGVYKLSAHSAMEFVWQGEKTGALPDGRKASSELSKNASAVNGADRNGVTALIQSSLKLQPCHFTETFCVDVMLSPSATDGEDGLEAMYGLLMTYLKNGGMSIQFNIFNADTLRDAQKNPEKYKNLQVRVCGWNVLWNNLSPTEQEAYILRAEGISE